MIVFHHKNCMDGFGAAFLIWKHVDKHAKFIPVQYDDYLPEDIIDKCRDKHVIIADFSFDRETMMEIINVSQSMICFDHHKTAKEAIEDVPGCIFDMEESGMSLVDKHYNCGHWLTDFIKDRDLWNWKLPHSRAVNAGLRTYKFDFEVWDRLTFGEVFQTGTVINNYLEKQAWITAQHKQLAHLPGGVQLVVSNCTHGDIISDVGQRLAAEGPPAGTFFIKGNDVVFSVRGPGVRELAEQFGGGGHDEAAGFKLDRVLVRFQEIEE